MATVLFHILIWTGLIQLQFTFNLKYNFTRLYLLNPYSISILMCVRGEICPFVEEQCCHSTPNGIPVINHTKIQRLQFPIQVSILVCTSNFCRQAMHCFKHQISILPCYIIIWHYRTFSSIRANAYVFLSTSKKNNNFIVQRGTYSTSKR